MNDNSTPWAERKLLMKLQEAEDAVKEGKGWLSLDELKAAMGNLHEEASD